jgi:hypothetical protein
LDTRSIQHPGTMHLHVDRALLPPLSAGMPAALLRSATNTSTSNRGHDDLGSSTDPPTVERISTVPPTVGVTTTVDARKVTARVRSGAS